MPTIQCPHCNHEARVPSLEQIAGKNVKCPSCSQTFYVEPEAPAPSVNGFDFQDQTPHISSSPRRSASASSSSSQWKSLLSPLTYDPHAATSAKRYPNLLRYIAIAETLILIFFRIAIVLVCIAFVLIEVSLFLQLIRWPNVEGVLMMLACPVGAILYLLIIWLHFIAAMAFIKFLRVIIDIENNTHG